MRCCPTSWHASTTATPGARSSGGRAAAARDRARAAQEAALDLRRRDQQRAFDAPAERTLYQRLAGMVREKGGAMVSIAHRAAVGEFHTQQLDAGARGRGRARALPRGGGAGTAGAGIARSSPGRAARRPGTRRTRSPRPRRRRCGRPGEQVWVAVRRSGLPRWPAAEQRELAVALLALNTHEPSGEQPISRPCSGPQREQRAERRPPSAGMFVSRRPRWASVALPCSVDVVIEVCSGNVFSGRKVIMHRE